MHRERIYHLTENDQRQVHQEVHQSMAPWSAPAGYEAEWNGKPWHLHLSTEELAKSFPTFVSGSYKRSYQSLLQAKLSA